MKYIDKHNKILSTDKLFWNKEKKFWNNYGKIYFNLEESDPYKEMLLEIKKIITGDNIVRKKWLDAGCGPGTMIDLILKNRNDIESIIGIDFDGVMLDHAINRMKKKSIVSFEKVDLAKTLSYDENMFDAIVANLVLSYIIVFNDEHVGINALREVLKEMYRILNKDGVLIWTTPTEKVNFNYVFIRSIKNMINPSKLHLLLDGPKILHYAKQIEKKGKIGIYHFIEREKLHNLMLEIGFRGVEIKKVFAGQAYLIKGKK